MSVQGFSSVVSGYRIGAAGGERPDVSAMAKRISERLDTDGDGKLSKSEFTSLKAPPAREGQEAPDTEEIFDRVDTDGDGALTVDELSSDMAANKPSGPPPGGPGGGPGGGGPGGGGPGAESSSASSATSEDETYEAADTNQDGTVSQAERLAWQIKQAISAYQASAEPQTATTTQQAWV